MVTKNQVVSLDYFIKDLEGNILESSKDGLLSYLHGFGQLPAALEDAIEGKTQGANVSVEFKAGECFGKYDDKLVMVMGPESFEEGLEIKEGRIFQNMTENGPEVIRVTKIVGNEITVDANHPYAGQGLIWDVIILSYRSANSGEIDQGYPDGMYSVGKGCCDTNSSCCDGEVELLGKSSGVCCGS